MKVYFFLEAKYPIAKIKSNILYIKHGHIIQIINKKIINFGFPLSIILIIFGLLIILLITMNYIVKFIYIYNTYIHKNHKKL